MSEENVTATNPAPSEETAEQVATIEPTGQGIEEPPARAFDDGTPIVLVTGASGFISSHVVKKLLEGGKYRVRGTVRNLKNEAKVKPVMDLVPNPARPLELVEAELTSEEAWKDAVRGCTYVLHIASPFPPNKPKNEDEVLRPAVEGTLNVLKACAESEGTVKRCVVVSSIAAISAGLHGPEKLYTPADWSDEALCPPYEKSKLRAEKAAWEFVKNLEESKKFELCTICPAGVLGPVLNHGTAAGSTSITRVILPIMANKMPSVPDVTIPLVDVRDVADAIIAAMEKPEAVSNRYILAYESAPNLLNISATIDKEFKPQGYKIPTKQMGNFMLWLGSLLDSSVKEIRQFQGKTLKYDHSNVVSDLGVNFTPLEKCIIDTCYSLVDNELVKKTQQYRGHPDTRPPPPPEPEPSEPPAEPEQPSEPPPEPEQPSEPPAEPEKPSEPPAEPEQPSEPPAEPEQPSEPPAEPEKPSEPPAEPEQPSEPPAEPEQPSEPQPQPEKPEPET